MRSNFFVLMALMASLRIFLHQYIIRHLTLCTSGEGELAPCPDQVVPGRVSSGQRQDKGGTLSCQQLSHYVISAQSARECHHQHPYIGARWVEICGQSLRLAICNINICSE